MASPFAAKRLARELAKIQTSLPPGIILISAPDLLEWQLDIRVLDANPIYLNQTFRLRFRFPPQYPIEPPEVMFIEIRDLEASASGTSAASDNRTRLIPMHPHVYSNGIICLDLLDKQGWSPVQNVESVCMSLQSMLTGNEKNERPEGDDVFVRTNRKRPKDIAFDFHDNKC